MVTSDGTVKRPDALADNPRRPCNMTCCLCGLDQAPTAPICKNGPCQICTEVTNVDEEINQVEANLRRLLSKRCDILSEHNRVHGTLIHRLPVELKNRIFELLLPSRNEWGVIEGTRRPSFLATISVCRAWRDVALSNPFLWSTMHIELATSMSPRGINDRVLRSRTLPLTLHIDNYELVKEDFERSRKVLADVMNLCSNRLQSLSLKVPSQVLGSQYNNFQYHRLTQLQIISSGIDQPLSLLNPTASPEKIVIEGTVSFQSLHISWNRLISATIFRLKLEDAMQLFQHASQMTFCRIGFVECGSDNLSMPPIIHHSLKAFRLMGRGAPDFLVSLTLPCLREFEVFPIHLKQISALVRRSSCPLTKLTLYLEQVEYPFDEFQPLSGLTDLVVRFWERSKGDALMRLLLEGHFPDLRHLTLGIQPFKVLWDIGAILILLDRKRPRPDEPNGGRFHKFIVVDQPRLFNHFWNWGVGEQLKELNVTLREDGFEFF